MIKIQTKETYIPIELGEVEMRFVLEDDSLLKLESKFNVLQHDIEKIDFENDMENKEKVEKVKGLLTRIYDDFFGEGTFDKVYKQTPSFVDLFSYFNEIADALVTELQKRGYGKSQKEKVDKYLSDKKKKK